MKLKINFYCAICSIFLFSIAAKAQQWSVSGTSTNTYLLYTGNVGIGSVAPAEKLDLGGAMITNGNNIYLAWDHNHGLGYYNIFTTTGNYASKSIDGPVLFGYAGGGLGTNQGGVKNVALSWLSDGKVGIGTHTPIQTLDVNGKIHVSGGVIQKGGSALLLTNDLGLYSLDPDSYMRFVTTGQPMLFFSDGGMGGTANMTIQANGNVVIGNTSTVSQPSGYKLFVQTGILTEKLKVALVGTAGWADFVFDEKYDLKNLSEVEAFIKANKHLPNVPSAEQVSKDGIDMATMDSKLLEKIEELTLYIIEQNKRIEALEKLSEKKD